MSTSAPDGLAILLAALGLIFMLAVAADLLGRHTPLPRVTILLLLGVAIGPGGFDWLPASVVDLFPSLTAIALTMVGFLLGARLTRRRLRRGGRTVLSVSLAVSLITCLLVAGGLLLIGVPVELALLLGAISTATAPAATADVVHESRASGEFADTLLGVVAIDDAWGLLLFSALLAVVAATPGEPGASTAAIDGLGEIVLAVGTGVVLGLPFALLTGRIAPGEPTQAEALAAVLLTAGLSLWLEISYILTAMVAGLTIASVARHHTRPFHELEGIEWPFLVIFFVMAGASLEPAALLLAGPVGIAFVLLRIAGRLIGARLGAAAARAPAATGRWLGIALLPQAGVSIGLALLAVEQLPELADVILPVVIGSTVIFEIIGPVGTRAALRAAAKSRPAT